MKIVHRLRNMQQEKFNERIHLNRNATIWEGLEAYAKYQKEITGMDSWPTNPLSVLGRTRGVIVTFALGIPDEDNEWQFDGTKLYHRRMNNEIWYFNYNAGNFTLSELPVKLQSRYISDDTMA